MRSITAEEYGALIDEIARLQNVNKDLIALQENLYSKKPLEFSQKLIIATFGVAFFTLICTFALAFLGLEYPEDLVNDIITLTLTAEGGYFAQNGIRSIFTGDTTIKNISNSNDD